MMKSFLRISLLYCVSFAMITDIQAQIVRPAVGGWNTYLPYNTTIDIATDGNIFYGVSTSSFFTFDQSDGTLTAYSKANGMSDVDMKSIAYDDLTASAVLIYQNGNIDVFKDGSFKNIPDFKITNISGDKTIYSTYCANGFAYISTSAGLIVTNLIKNEIKETIPFFDGSNAGTVLDASGKGTDIYAATSVGLFKSQTTNPLLINFQSWTKLSSTAFQFVSQKGTQAYAASGNTIYALQGNNLVAIKTLNAEIQKIDATSDNDLWVMTQAGPTPYAIKIDKNGTTLDSVGSFFAYRMLDIGDGRLWSCDGYAGLRSRSAAIAGDWASTYPAGPLTNGVFDVWAKDGMFWMAHGATSANSWHVLLNRDYFARYDKGSWRNFKWDVLGLQAPNQYNTTDALSVVKDEINNNVYFGLYNGGILKVDKDEHITNYKNGFLESNNQGDTASYRVTDLALDAENNLWITQSTSNDILAVKTFDDQWIHYNINGVYHAYALTIDDLGQKWFASGYNNGGLVVFNDNGTIADSSDDKVVYYRAGKNSGNLSDNTVLSIAKDKDGAMWVGTKSGISIFNCNLDIRQGLCEAYLKPLVTKGYNFANYMFEGIPVNSIAIDGGNRKWIGTTSGLFLLTEDGEDILAAYNEQNSPLLSNNVLNLNIDPVTGIVYIATDKGLCSFGGAANEAGSQMQSPLFVYPNPVPSGYNGMVTIKGVTAASDVRITDINGQLVYKTTSTGGQVAWNGKDYNGRKVQSGVYLVFVVSKDGTQKTTGKFIVHE